LFLYFSKRRAGEFLLKKMDNIIVQGGNF